MKKASLFRHLGLAVFVCFFSLLGNLSFAEPWLSNRYAQNCAACHAPGRYNQPAIGRHCTLSCNGCHVNPNGGGLRNEYGRWNQERWLKSFSAPSWYKMNKPIPAPDFYQPYVLASARKYGTISKWVKHQLNREDERAKAGHPTHYELDQNGIAPLVATHRAFVNQGYYTEKASQDFRKIATSQAMFESRLPKEDPYRVRREKSVTAGGDFRYIYGTLDGTYNGAKPTGRDKNLSFLMDADLGASYRPIPEHLAMVVESRFGAAPEDSDAEDVFTSGAHVRSAYVISDMLPYGSYVMYGLYRPGFGYYHPDHNTIANQISGLTQYAVFKALGAGAAPNVPFANINIIQPTTHNVIDGGTGRLTSREKGYNINFGGRAVTLGLSGKVSYWITTNDDLNRRRTMYSLTGGGKFWRLIGNFEYLTVQDNQMGSSTAPANRGNVTTLDLRFRTWHENYVEAYYSTANTALDLTEGSASELMYGVRSFVVAGVDLEFLMIHREEHKKDSSFNPFTNYDLAQFQMHLYF